MDGCSKIHTTFNSSYAILGGLLAAAAARRGKGPVVYNPTCLTFNYPRQFRELAAIGNQWRVAHDITDTWDSMASVVEHIGAGQPECRAGPLPSNCTGWHYSVDGQLWCESFCVERDAFLAAPGRGGWHDADSLLVGNSACSPADQKRGMACGSLTEDEEQVQMALWSMAASPLLMSADLAAVSPASKATLLNREVLAVQADPLGRMGFRFQRNTTTGAQSWRKDLVGGAVAVALVSMGSPPPPGNGSGCSWNHTQGGYAEACGGDHGDLYCGDFGQLDSAKQRCCADPACTGFSIATTPTGTGPAWHGCLKRGKTCGYATNPDFDGYQKLPASRWRSAPGAEPGIVISLNFGDVGFSPDTRVQIRDLFRQQDLGTFRGSWYAVVPPHGVRMLKLTFAPPQYTEL